MPNQIIDIVEIFNPGPMGDVTPEAIAARDAAEGYRDQAAEEKAGAEAARDEAAQFASGVVALQDESVRDIASSDQSLTRIFLDATFSAKADLVSGLAWPMYISHRGGALRYPEHSREAYRASAQAGFYPEPDLRMLSDGTLVCLHDETVDRTMTGVTGPVSDLTPEQWMSGRIRGRLWPLPRAVPFFWEDVLDEFGGRTLIVPEVRGEPGMVEAFIWSVKRRGLDRAVIAQSFFWEVCVQLAAAGITTCYLSQSADPVALKAAGVEYTSCDVGAASAAYIASHNAQGIRVLVYGIVRYSQAQQMLSREAFGVFSDDPWAHSGRYREQFVQNYSDDALWVGSEGFNTGDRFVDLGKGQRAFRLVAGSVAARHAEQGWAGRISAAGITVSWSMRLTGQHFGTSSDSGRIYLSSELRKSANEGDPNFLLLMVRRNGQAVVYRKKDGGAVEAIATQSGFAPALADGVEGERHRYSLNIDTDGNLTFSREGGASTITVPAASYGLQDLWGLWLTAASAGVTVEFSDWVIDPN